jgi:hypothetical protein
MGNARHLNLDRDRDVALDLLGRLARALSDDIDQRRYRIGIGLDVELDEGDDAGGAEKKQQGDHKDPLLQGEGDNPIHESDALPS